MGLFIFLGRLIVQIFRIIRLMFPWVMRVVWAGLKAALIAIFTVFERFPVRSKEIADEWWEKFFQQRSPFSPREQRVWKFFYYVAYATLIAGWIFVSYLTVWFIGVILSSL